MFVCNKVDITEEVNEFDYSDEDDNDDDDDYGDEVEGGPGKEEIVFNQLKERNFLSVESLEKCDLFHAISAKDVRKERRKNIEEAATWRFQRFQIHLQSLIGKVMKTQTSRVASIQVDDETDAQTLTPFSQLEDIKKEVRESPKVFFTGERNCGKSSIINELLRQSSLPVFENPCTARIVRIKYAEQSYARLVGSGGREVKRELLTSKKIPEKLIAVPDEERENKLALNAIVEVGMKHELLSSGTELIDSAGKSESDVLDTVLDDFLKKGTVPLFVYVIDGDMHLTYSVS